MLYNPKDSQGHLIKIWVVDLQRSAFSGHDMTGNNMSRVWQVQKANLFVCIEPEIDRSPTLQAQRGRGICEQEAG